MKRLIALMMCAVSLGANAQFPNLPYNPDENGDGLIGVTDLQGVLSLYGLNWEEGSMVSAVGPELEVFPNDFEESWQFFLVPNEVDLIEPPTAHNVGNYQVRWLIPQDREHPLIVFGLMEFGEFNDSLIYIRLNRYFDNVSAIGPWSGDQLYSSSSGTFMQRVQREMAIMFPAFGSWWVK